MDEAYTPVVKAKPERGREIKSAKIPTEKLIESLKNVSGKPDPSSEGREEIYHEGYVDGQKYLVPDSNLEAMKDIINIKMAPRRSLHYKHETSFEISPYDHLRDKLKGLLDKIGQSSDTSLESRKESSAANSVSAETDEFRGTRTDSKADGESKRSEADSKESKASKESSVATLKLSSSKSMEQGIYGPKDESNLTENAEDYKEKDTKQESNKDKKQEDDIAYFTDKVKSKSLPVTVLDKEKESLEISEDEKEPITLEEPLGFYGEQKAPMKPQESLRLSDEEKKPLQLQKPVRFSEEEEKPVKLQQSWRLIDEEKKIPQFQEPSQLSDEDEEPLQFQEPLQVVDEEKEPPSLKEPFKLPEYSVGEKVSTKEPSKFKGPLTFSDQLKPSLMKRQVFESIEPKECHVRFLISGHLRDDKPIFIIQEYNGKSDIFNNQKADFIDSKRNGDIDLAISGKFYKNNILEELNGEPISYNILPEKIIINQEKSKVYTERFSDVFYCERVVLTVKGDFLRHEISNFLTPLLSFSVEPKIPDFSSSKENYNPYSNDAPTTVLIYTPTYVNHFAYDDNDKIMDNNNGSAAVLVCESHCTNPFSCVEENNIHSNDSMGPISLYVKDSTNSFSSMLENNMKEDNLHTVVHASPSKNQIQNQKTVDRADVIGYEPKHREHYSKKQWDRNRHQHFPSFCESLNARETTLQEPKPSSYYYADDIGEYYSTYNNYIPDYAKHDALRQQDYSNNKIDNIATKNELNNIKTPKEKDSTRKTHENPLGKEKQESKNVAIKSDDFTHPLHEESESPSKSVDHTHVIGYQPKRIALWLKKHLDRKTQKTLQSPYKSLNAAETTLKVPEPKTYYSTDDKGEYYSNYKDEEPDDASHADLQQDPANNKIVKCPTTNVSNHKS